MSIQNDWAKKVVVIGAGGHGKEVIETCKEIYLNDRSIELLGFLDDNKELHGTTVYGTHVLGGFDWIDTQEDKDIYFVCSIGDSLIRKKVVRRALAKKYKPITLIHPRAGIHNPKKIGNGTVIQSGSNIAPNVIIGDYCHINYSCSIGHDSILGNFTTLTPLCALSGFTKTGECAYFGTGSIVLPGLTIGEYSIVGAGSVVLKDTEPYTVNVGSPTRIIRDIKK